MSHYREQLRELPVLVTGADGFIGARLVDRLTALGARVSALVRHRSALNAAAGATYFEADLGGKGLDEAVRHIAPCYAFHLAAYTNPARNAEHAREAMSVNLLGTMRLLALLHESGAQRIVLTGTAEEYGNSPVPVREDAPLQPTSPYSVSKAAATLWALMQFRTAGLPVVILRPFICYGPGQPPVRFVAQAIEAALAGRALAMTAGAQTRDFTHVDDVLDAYMCAAFVPGVEGEIFNVATGVETRILHAAERIYALAGSAARPRPGELPYRPEEVWRSAADISKARRMLGWAPRIGFEDGLRSTIDWYRRSGTVAAPAQDSENAR